MKGGQGYEKRIRSFVNNNFIDHSHTKINIKKKR